MTLMRSVVSRLPRGMRPLSRRLPLTVAIIVSTMMAIVLFQAFRRVDDLAAEVAVTHLRSSSQQLSAVLQGVATRLRRDIGQLSSVPALERAASPLATEADRRAAREVLAGELGLGRNAQVASVALWSRDGKLVL